MKELYSVECDKCGKHIFWSTCYDLNGEEFYCDECYEQAKQEEV
jgi:formylmethanofuran dehydrogenase subunit E